MDKFDEYLGLRREKMEINRSSITRSEGAKKKARFIDIYLLMVDISYHLFVIHHFFLQDNDLSRWMQTEQSNNLDGETEANQTREQRRNQPWDPRWINQMHQ